MCYGRVELSSDISLDAHGWSRCHRLLDNGAIRGWSSPGRVARKQRSLTRLRVDFSLRIY